MGERHRNLYYKLSASKKKVPTPPKVEEDDLSDYMVEHMFSFIPKSKTLENLVDGLNNGKVHRISRRK